MQQSPNNGSRLRTNCSRSLAVRCLTIVVATLSQSKGVRRSGAMIAIVVLGVSHLKNTPPSNSQGVTGIP